MRYLFYLILSFLSIQSCLAQDDPKVAIPKEYESCCGVQPVEYKLADHSVFVPNVFTPNGDGINDLFHPFISGQIAEIQRFTILSAEGDTVLFKRPTIVYDRLNQFGWDGLREDGTYHRGKFRYGMIVVGLDEKVRIVEGEACSVLCEPGTNELKVKKGCFYPSQAGKQEKAGKLDDTLPNNEKDCIK